MVKHRGLDLWLFPGGHWEDDEEPDQTAIRETREETGLQIEIPGSQYSEDEPLTRILPPPLAMDVHPISNTHRHIGIVYLARVVPGTALVLVPQEAEIVDIKWLTQNGILRLPKESIPESLRGYAINALRLAPALPA